MLKNNSKLIKHDDTFIAIKGENVDGHDYIEEAINNGASMIIAEHGNYKVKTKIVKSTKKYLINYLKKNMPSIKLIGITGTNGKTTSAYLIYRALNLLNINCAYIGTIGFYLDKKICDLNNTTPSNIELFNLINEAYLSGCKYVVMEVSSHALKQGRCDFLSFDYSILTNITEDHLDYHKTFKDYVNSKQKLFKKLTKGLNIINIDSTYSNYCKVNKYITYGYESSADFKIKSKGRFIKVGRRIYLTKLRGIHNTYNFSLVAILMKCIGVSYVKSFNVLKKLTAPPGRLEEIIYKKNKIFVDYAHTPDAVKNVLETAKKMKHKKIITILGCGGNREKEKRPIMGGMATNNSDYVIFTNDNPRYEKDTDIVNDILVGVSKSNFEIILNRGKAIEKGIQLLRKNDILMVLGKGHEDYQIIGNKKCYFSDTKYIKDYIKKHRR